MMNLYLFDDELAKSWKPFTLTRPAGELTLGILSMRERAEALWGEKCLGHITCPSLQHFDELDAPPVLGLDDIHSGKPVILFSSRAILDPSKHTDGTVEEILLHTDRHKQPQTLVIGEQIVGWVFPKGFTGYEDINSSDPGASKSDFPEFPLSGTVLENMWDLVTVNGEQINKDVNSVPLDHARCSITVGVPHGVTYEGNNPIIIESGAIIAPNTHLDSRSGSILISTGAYISPFTHIIGPAFVGARTRLLGGSMSCFTAGPECKLRGEISNSVILSHTNKSHDGYLGHSYVGRWVNFGALTCNSDLKNNYGEIKILTNGQLVNTGQQKLGIFVGDHVKTGIGSLFPGGCTIGCGTNFFGGGMAPHDIPPFSWGTANDLEPYDLSAFLQMVRKVMTRRDVELTSKAEKLLLEAWESTRPHPDTSR